MDSSFQAVLSPVSPHLNAGTTSTRMEEWRGRGVAREACEAIDAIDKREREAGRRKPRTANRHP